MAAHARVLAAEGVAGLGHRGEGDGAEQADAARDGDAALAVPQRLLELGALLLRKVAPHLVRRRVLVHPGHLAHRHVLEVLLGILVLLLAALLLARLLRLALAAAAAVGGGLLAVRGSRGVALLRVTRGSDVIVVVAKEHDRRRSHRAEPGLQVRAHLRLHRKDDVEGQRQLVRELQRGDALRVDVVHVPRVARALLGLLLLVARVARRAEDLDELLGQRGLRVVEGREGDAGEDLRAAEQLEDAL